MPGIAGKNEKLYKTAILYYIIVIMKILVVEDEVKVSNFIRRGLEEEGYTVEVAEDGRMRPRAHQNEGIRHRASRSHDTRNRRAGGTEADAGG